MVGKTKRFSLAGAGGSILVTFFALLCVAPLVYMVLMSFTQLRTLYIRLEDITFNLQNYYIIIFKNSFGRALLNSIIVAVLSCVWTDLVCAMAAYGFEKKPVPGKEKLFKVYLATMMIPSQVTLIPLFLIMRQIGWLNSYAALVVPMAGAFGCFMLRQFMKNVDDVFIEAAQIDGCPEPLIFLRVVLPLVQPALISLTIFTFVSAWNSFIWPLVVNTNTQMYTFPIALSLLDSQHDTNYGLTMAAAAASFVIPFAMYVGMQEQFVEGIALGGVKG
ncbi:carbohydrate ABC transporter permease [Ruminococcaceae bacterium OttesenSCG-928-D13]|nr:carbohydrate ABC transporter permease [Ruminococcaceae bacterium OttesenSCG-928-D13]